MKERPSRTKILLVLLACAAFMAGAALLAASLAAPHKFAMGPLPCLILMAGSFSLFLAFLGHDRPFRLFLGLNLCIDSAFVIIAGSRPAPVSSASIWPVLVIAAGMTLIPLSVYNRRKVIAKYLVPAIGLIFLGAAYLIFALKLVDGTLAQFIVRWWFVFAIIAVALLLGLFFWQIKIRKNFPNLVEDPESAL